MLIQKPDKVIKRIDFLGTRKRLSIPTQKKEAMIIGSGVLSLWRGNFFCNGF